MQTSADDRRRPQASAGDHQEAYVEPRAAQGSLGESRRLQATAGDRRQAYLRAGLADTCWLRCWGMTTMRRDIEKRSRHWESPYR